MVRWMDEQDGTILAGICMEGNPEMDNNLNQWERGRGDTGRSSRMMRNDGVRRIGGKTRKGRVP